MTAPRALLRACALLPLAAIVAVAHAQDRPEGAGYRIVASTLDGGAPQTSNDGAGHHELRGTIGQPDAAVSGVGPYRLEGGFWPVDKRARGAAVFLDGFESP